MSIEQIFQQFPSIETRSLVLRRMQPTDTQDLLKILGDDEVTRYYDDVTFTTLTQAHDQIEAWERGFTSKRCIRWGITRKPDPALIGTCGFYGIHTWHMRAGIGYELARAAWRLGIMMEALGAVIGMGFREMGLNRIEAVVMPENLPSIKLLEKLGFQNEGLLREYENWGEKGFTDLYMLSLLRKTWEQS